MGSSRFLPMTKEGLEKAKKELKQLKTVERPNVIEAIAVARSHGDLSENAEYDAAKERQGFLEQKIAELEDRLSRVQIIETSSTKEIIFGAHVKVQEIGYPDTEEYHLVGEDESNPAEGKISTVSPMGRSLLNKKKGDTAEVITPSGKINMKIVDFWYE